MIQHWLSIFPQPPGESALIGALAGAVFGAALWLIGARFRRSLVTWFAVAVGAAVGMQAPAWLGWPVSGMSFAVVGAIAFGISGYVLQTTWLGVTFGTALALWACLISWVTLADGAGWHAPEIDWSSRLHVILNTVWRSLPDPLDRVMPCALAGGFASGIVLTVVWPKLARVIAFSLIGATLLAGMGLAAAVMGRPDWLTALPADTRIQLAAFAGMVALGAIVQWLLIPKVRLAAPPAREPEPRREPSPAAPIRAVAPKPARATAVMARPAVAEVPA